jgi:hypothetical protein
VDRADRSALLRLVQIKAARDVPYAFDACFNSWLTVRGDDQRGIMRVLGLADALPATYALGETLVNHLAHGGPSRQETFDHVFISPELNGWTIIRGPSCNPDESPNVTIWVARLSDDYGQAQAYFYGSQCDPGWLVSKAASSVAIAVTTRRCPLVPHCQSNSAGSTTMASPLQPNRWPTTNRSWIRSWIISPTAPRRLLPS